MDRLKELLGGNEFLNSNRLQTALGIPPAKFIKMINEFDIPYYVDNEYFLSEETAMIEGGGIVDHQPSQSPVDLSMLGKFKFHEGDLREAARRIEAFYPLLEEVNGNQKVEGIDSSEQLIAENARLREALKALANDIVGVSRNDSGERSQSVLGTLTVGVETEDNGAPRKGAPDLTAAQALVDQMRARCPRPTTREIAKAVDAQYPGIAHSALGGLLAKEGDIRNSAADLQRGRRARGHKY